MGKGKAYKTMLKALQEVVLFHKNTYCFGVDRAVEEAMSEFNGDLEDGKNGAKVLRTFSRGICREAASQEEMAKFAAGGLPNEQG